MVGGIGAEHLVATAADIEELGVDTLGEVIQRSGEHAYCQQHGRRAGLGGLFEELDGQVTDWLNGRNGLASHTAYTFWQPGDAQRAHVRTLFNASN